MGGGQSFLNGLYTCGKWDESHKHFHKLDNAQATQKWAMIMPDANQTKLQKAHSCNAFNVKAISHLQQEVRCRLPTIFGKEDKRKGYLLIQNNGDLHNTLCCAQMDKKTKSSNKIITRQNTPIEKSELDAASEGATPDNFSTVINAQTHLWAEKTK